MGKCHEKNYQKISGKIIKSGKVASVHLKQLTASERWKLKR